MSALRSGVLALALASGCAQKAEDYGRALAADPSLSDSQFNAFSCRTCHSVEEDGGKVRIGYSLQNSAFRPSYWGGAELRFLDAVNFCFVYFMRAGAPLGPSDPQARALYEYLVAISPDRPSPALPFTVVENVNVDVHDIPRGEVTRGQTVYDQGCRVCHGAPRTGEGRISPLTVVIPNASEEYAQANGISAALVVVEKVRHGQFFNVGGNMPPFSQEALSDEDLGALLSYLGL